LPDSRWPATPTMPSASDQAAPKALRAMEWRGVFMLRAFKEQASYQRCIATDK